MKRFGMCFSRDFEKNDDPLGHIGEKLPVYLRLLELCRKEGWEVYVLTRKTYKGNGIFEGAWLFNGGNKFSVTTKPVKIDLVYDRSGGINFPPDNDKLDVVNRRNFKILCWNKWLAYKEIGKFMAKTFWVGKGENLPGVLDEIKTELVVLKPFNGLKGMGIYIGPKNKAKKFDLSNKKYIAQEFLDTSAGIPGIVTGIHDLRVAIANGKAVWCHVRTPMEGKLKANVAEGGTLTEIDYKIVPGSVKKIVDEISKYFYQQYDNPSYSIDFGIEKGKPFIFEINDQIGFPKWEMKNRDNFLKELVKNFKEKLVLT